MLETLTESDDILLGKINRKRTRLQRLKAIHANPRIIHEINQSDIKYIEKICNQKGYATQAYLDYYNRKPKDIKRE